MAGKRKVKKPGVIRPAGRAKSSTLRTKKTIKNKVRGVHTKIRHAVEDWKYKTPTLSVILTGYLYTHIALEKIFNIVELSFLQLVLIKFGEKVREYAADILEDGRLKGEKMDWPAFAPWTISMKRHYGKNIDGMMRSGFLRSSFTGRVPIQKYDDNAAKISLTRGVAIFEIEGVKIRKKHYNVQGGEKKYGNFVSRKLRVRIGSRVSYAALLETGGVNEEGRTIPARPYLMPAYMSATKDLKKIIETLGIPNLDEKVDEEVQKANTLGLAELRKQIRKLRQGKRSDLMRKWRKMSKNSVKSFKIYNKGKRKHIVPKWRKRR